MNYNMLDIGDSFRELLSLAEAAEIWHKEESTIRKAIAQGRLVDGEDCRKFGKQWVVTVQGMTKAFPNSIGQPSYGYWADHLCNLRREKHQARENSR